MANSVEGSAIGWLYLVRGGGRRDKREGPGHTPQWQGETLHCMCTVYWLFAGALVLLVRISLFNGAMCTQYAPFEVVLLCSLAMCSFLGVFVCVCVCVCVICTFRGGSLCSVGLDASFGSGLLRPLCDVVSLPYAESEPLYFAG